MTTQCINCGGLVLRPSGGDECGPCRQRPSALSSAFALTVLMLLAFGALWLLLAGVR